MVDAATKKTVAAIPQNKTKAGPRDGDQWVTRLKEEYQSLIKVSFLFFFLFFVLTEVSYNKTCNDSKKEKFYKNKKKDLSVVISPFLDFLLIEFLLLCFQLLKTKFLVQFA